MPDFGSFGVERRLLRPVHWMSAGLSLGSLCFFAVTGFLLNNDGLVKFEPRPPVRIEKPLDEALASAVSGIVDEQPLPDVAAKALAAAFSADMRYGKVRSTKGRTTITLPDPGFKTTVEIDPKAQKISYERTNRGPIAFLTDLHKGKNVKPLWHLFIDVFAISVLVFALSGLGLLWTNASRRRSTWPLIGFGLVAPLGFFLILSHAV